MIARLDVDRRQLLGALRLMFTVARPQYGEPAILRHIDGQLRIRAGGKEVGAKAVGHWPGEARSSGNFLLALPRC